MARRIITNPKFILEIINGNYVLKFKDGNVYRPIEFDDNEQQKEEK